ncbi:S41 family peptidase [Caldibacillus lycopersici]|uniref:C-terminal processing peptidase n=1 Tax=Perspicuibacillus lycopersici TaxID=1325689 RepID=A0AAE3LSP3_9BACI|nr:S41 family peptidase [Perspicuibacillus lycopersici]MCU9612958.1 S41 family peptidase [Perspicuibacillus lycopersici]
MKKSWIIGLMIGSMLVASSGTYASMKWFDQTSSEENTEQYFQPSGEGTEAIDLSKVEKAYELIQNAYVEEVEEKDLVEGAVQGMLATLDDPYSVYMNEEKASQFNSSLDSSFEGIGAEISELDGKIIIVAPFKNSPAEKAGLKPYDQILKVDGEDVTNFDLYDVTLKIRGKKGTNVLLEVQREGLSEPIAIEVKRDTIPMETVYSSVMKSGNANIGYIEITQFSRETGKDFIAQLKALEKKKIEGLIIDVRGNPGGLLSSVEEIAGALVTDQKPMLQIEGRDGQREQVYSKLKEKKDYPMVVLTDKGSASASEILAAALKEGEGYLTIGEKTFGKGTVQQQVDLGDNSNIKLTMYKWLTPDGNWIHKEGIDPDIHVLQSDLYHLHPIQVETTLSRDMNNEQIKNAQTLLKSIGFEPGRLDGYYSETTEAAVKAFQQQNDLPVTGTIDKQTAEAMEAKVVEELNNQKNDRQLQTALKYFQYGKK